MSKTTIKQDTITEQQSKTLMKNMVRISVSSICYHRDLFPPSCFVFKPYGNMEIVQLDAAYVGDSGDIVVKDHKAFTLTQWLEKGVFKVLEDNHLSSMTFAIYMKHPVTNADLLLEAYEFKFSIKDGKPSINDVQVKSKEDIKTQAGKFVRNLVLFSSSLDELPTDTWITIEIKYNDSVPEGYEPDYFKTADKSGLSFSGAECLRVRLGHIDTPFLNTDAKFIGLESLLHENLCSIGLSESKLSVKPKEMFRGQSTTIEEIPVNEIQSHLNKLEVDDSDKVFAENLEKIRKYVLATCSTSVNTISSDVNISGSEVKRALAILAAEQILIAQTTSAGALRYKFNFKTFNPPVPTTTSSLTKRTHAPAVIEDIEELSATPRPNKQNTTYVKSSLQLKAPTVNKVDNEKPALNPQDEINYSSLKKEAAMPQLSQVSDFSQVSNTKKRMYGKVRDPIDVKRSWKKQREGAVITPN